MADVYGSDGTAMYPHDVDKPSDGTALYPHDVDVSSDGTAQCSIDDGTNNSDVCAICLNDLSSCQNLHRITTCDHVFCRECIRQCRKCPLCRKPIPDNEFDVQDDDV